MFVYKCLFCFVLFSPLGKTTYLCRHPLPLFLFSFLFLFFFVLFSFFVLFDSDFVSLCSFRACVSVYVYSNYNHIMRFQLFLSETMCYWPDPRSDTSYNRTRYLGNRVVLTSQWLGNQWSHVFIYRDVLCSDRLRDVYDCAPHPHPHFPLPSPSMFFSENCLFVYLLIYLFIVLFSRMFVYVFIHLSVYHWLSLFRRTKNVRLRISHPTSRKSPTRICCQSAYPTVPGSGQFVSKTGVHLESGRPGAGIMEADDRQVTTVFTVQPSFHHRHSTKRVSWSVTIVGERRGEVWLHVRRRW